MNLDVVGGLSAIVTAVSVANVTIPKIRQYEQTQKLSGSGSISSDLSVTLKDLKG